MKTPIIILHGWGVLVSGEKYKASATILTKSGYTVYTPDLPGFGKNPLKKDALTFEDYVAFVKLFLDTHKIKKCILVGHSFGGRIAIRFTTLYPEYAEKLVLCGASGIPRPLPSIKKKVVYYATIILSPLFLIPPFSFFYKILRKVIYYAIGEMDYYKAGNLTQTFKNVHRVSIVSDLEQITIPTLVLWGENDIITPLADGELMHSKIKNSKLVVVKNATHKLPYENPEAFCEAIESFL